MEVADGLEKALMDKLEINEGDLKTDETLKTDENSLGKDDKELPKFPEHPLADRVEELQLMKAVDEDPVFYEELKNQPISFYQKMRQTPDVIARKYYPDMCRRFIECERRIKKLEDQLWQLPREERSLEEDRFEILTELLDKTCQGLEIWDEHQEKCIPWGERLVLEGQLSVSSFRREAKLG